MTREFSDLKLQRKECEKCGAVWINGEHRWATGAPGNEKDLAGLVCNNLGDEKCINPCRGDTTGDTWEKRREEGVSDIREDGTPHISPFDKLRQEMEDRKKRFEEGEYD